MLFLVGNLFVTEGHALIVPKRHVVTLWELNEVEQKELVGAIVAVKEKLDDLYHPDGYNIGINNGEVAGQTVFHLHVHVIPRRAGDVENPRGGITKFMPPLRPYE